MNQKKRNVLKGLALGTAWITPVVTSVTIPAHARTSLCTITVSGSIVGTTVYQTVLWIADEEPSFPDDYYVYREDSGVGSSSDSETMALPPGTYWVGWYSSGPSTNNSYTVSCCEESEGVTDQPSSVCGGHVVVINPDGTCSVSDDGPCLV